MIVIQWYPQRKYATGALSCESKSIQIHTIPILSLDVLRTISQMEVEMGPQEISGLEAMGFL
jgi:hypothetical protein